MASEKEDYFSTMAFSESWFESYWKSMARIESSNKSLVTKMSSGIRMCNHWKMEEHFPESTCSNLIKNFWKWLQQVINMRSHAIDY